MGKNLTGGLVLLLMIGLGAPLGHPQNGSNNPSNGSGGNGQNAASNSTSQSGANAETNINMAAPKSGFIQAAPGSIPGVFPGSARSAPCYLFAPPMLTTLTWADLKEMAKGRKLRHGINVTVMRASDDRADDGSIGVMRYNPRAIVYPDDKVLGTAIISGKYLHPDEQFFARAVLALRDQLEKDHLATHMHRVAAINCPDEQSVTKTNSYGLGGIFSETPGGGNTANSAALGISKGKSTTDEETRAVLLLYAFNDGPLEGPTPPPATPVAVAAPQPTPPVQTIRIEVVPVSPPPPIAPVPVPVPEALTGTAPTLPVIEIHFGFDCNGVFDRCVKSHESISDWNERSHKNQVALDTLRGWLATFPGVKVDVVGSACHHASTDYNAALGLRRSHAVFKILQEDEKIRGQVFEYDSNGKEHSMEMGPKEDEHNKEDRKVIFVVRGSDSSKK